LSEAVPTDGLWDDARTDESQLGASYEELEWAMKFREDFPDGKADGRNGELLAIYDKWHNSTRHKFDPIPTFKR
jgi:NAD+ synthase